MWPFSALFPPPTEAWLRTVSSDPEAQGWGAWGGVRKTPPGPRQGGGRAEEDDDEGFSLSLLEPASLAECPVPDRAEEPPEPLGSQEEAREETRLRAWQLLDPETTGCPFPEPPKEKVEADHRSIFVGNVDYGSTAQELESYFRHCGEIHRVTILCDKVSGHPKGYAYIEFASRSSAQAAVGLNERTFRGRVIKVLPKRTNIPGIRSTDRGARQAYRGPRAVLYPQNAQGGPPPRGQRKILLVVQIPVKGGPQDEIAEADLERPAGLLGGH
ncbi:embryonic polyadenylate-binding protein 2 [Perognathus longimembris pacificus]|uniref:embryonic polyadenylate-binding protein 2 n=1 Tax=Perognathus longimembris pacificus TaxID=214514 RepID=UPI002019056A|nr:embryonic polyadenylate-binding protein 2 [Perognathus longimembris pacificus]